MKVININILDDLEEIDIENDNVDVSIDTDDGYTYTLSFATSKHLQFLMNKEKIAYYGPGYPFIIVNKLTPTIIEETVKAFAEKDGGYWLKVHHFGGWHGAIDESIFDQLETKYINERKESDTFDKLCLMWETKFLLKDPLNKTDLIRLLDQYCSGNSNPGIRTRVVPGTCVSELKTSRGVRIYFQEKNEKIEVVAIADKDTQKSVICSLMSMYEKNNF